MKQRQWFAVYTRSRAEKRALKELKEQGIEVYLPLQRKLRQWSDRRKWVEEPLIRCYIFVKIDNRDYYNVLNTQGVVCFITFEGKAVPVPENQIDILRKVVATETDVEVTADKFEPGDSVRIVSGPMIGLEGELVDYRGKRRVMIRIETIGQQLIVSIPAGFLEPVR